MYLSLILHFRPPLCVVVHGRIPLPQQLRPQTQVVASDLGGVAKNSRLLVLVFLLGLTGAPWGVGSWSSRWEVAGNQLLAVSHPFRLFQSLLPQLALLLSSCYYSSVFGSPVMMYSLSEYHYHQNHSATKENRTHSLAITLLRLGRRRRFGNRDHHLFPTSATDYVRAAPAL